MDEKAKKINYVVQSCDNISLDFTPTDPGSEIQLDYALSYDDDGVQVAVVSGERNIQDYINSFKDDCDIYKILARVGAGHTELLDRRRGSFIDISSLPSNIHEAHQSIVQAELFFDQLPNDVRSRYHHSFREFLADYGSEQFNSIFKPVSAEVAPVKEEASSGKDSE